MDADRDVVGKDREVELLVQDAEVLLDLGHAAEGVEGRGGHEGVGAELLGDLAVLEHALGLGVDDAHQDGHAVVDDADGLGDDLAAALVGGEDDLAGGAEEEQAVDAGVDHVVDEALEGRDVELVVGRVGDDDGRDDASDLEVCHADPFSCATGGSSQTLDGALRCYGAGGEKDMPPADLQSGRARRRARGEAVVPTCPGWGGAATGPRRGASWCRRPAGPRRSASRGPAP